MDEKERAEKDIKKLDAHIKLFKELKLHEKYSEVFDWVTNYFNDSKHFFSKKDYYSAFGAANYAYGMLDAILIFEGKKDDS